MTIIHSTLFSIVFAISGLQLQAMEKNIQASHRDEKKELFNKFYPMCRFYSLLPENTKVACGYFNSMIHGEKNMMENVSKVRYIYPGICNGDTVLHAAVRVGALEMIIPILKGNSQLRYIANKNGKKPIDLATSDEVRALLATEIDHEEHQKELREKREREKEEQYKAWYPISFVDQLLNTPTGKKNEAQCYVPTEKMN